ncbi:hypothetical protein VZ94_00375 [Methylocucumis oryzae]|uniref:Tail sheath protein subtilisin-like domain-containing protein n=1 Tax=Methylocucumis oryzae TaxID=1632867 RepID=A0A0F3IN05_9GAMM|nr:hypothetical protein VZ94_00375 [Methylocucumis oryzae]
MKNGAAAAVLQRLVPQGSKNKYIVVKSGTSIKLTPTIRDGILNTISVINQGTAAYPLPTVTISDGALGKVYVTVDKDGVIVGVDVEGGSGYLSNSTITFGGSGGSGATATLSGVKNGSLNNAKVTITNGGTGYPHPSVAFTGSGTGGEVYVTLYASGAKAGKIKAITVAKGGRDYNVWNAATNPTVVAITGGTGAGATARVTDVIDGVITAISAPNAVGDYLPSVPRISIKSKKDAQGKRGSGASATCTIDDGDIDVITVVSGGSGYKLENTIVTANLAKNPQYILMNDLPDEEEEPYLFAIKDLECFNDGMIISMHCEEKLDSAGNKADNDRIHLRIIDPLKPRGYRYEFIGDLSDDGRDDFNSSTFLPDVVSRKTDTIEITVGQDAIVQNESFMYGYYEDDEDKAGEEKWVTSEVMKYFSEGTAEFEAADYIAARRKLIATPLDFAYISSLDTDSTAIIKELAQVSYETNKNLRFDVQGETVVEAVSFVDSLNLSERLENHLIHAFWSPQLCEDPSRNNGSLQMGSATLNIAFACARNRKKDVRGFAPKHYPIVGKDWPLNKVRSNIRQNTDLSRINLDRLARAKINPVIFQDGNFIFGDAITCANVDVSLRKLIAATDMSTSIDDAVVRFGRAVIGYPMRDAVTKTKDYLKSLFEGAEAAGWLEKSTDPEMLGKSFRFEVYPSEENPYEVIIVNYWVRYQGTARQVFRNSNLH